MHAKTSLTMHVRDDILVLTLAGAVETERAVEQLSDGVRTGAYLSPRAVIVDLSRVVRPHRRLATAVRSAHDLAFSTGAALALAAPSTAVRTLLDADPRVAHVPVVDSVHAGVLRYSLPSLPRARAPRPLLSVAAR